MTTNKAKTSSYNSVNSISIARYIKEYSDKIADMVRNPEYIERLSTHDRTQLKAIAAELETVCKRLEYLEGKY